MNPRIAILTDSPGWHSKQLGAAFSKKGCQAHYLALSDCRVSITKDNSSGLLLPGFEDKMPDGVFVRGIAAGSFEQVTLRLGFLHFLAQLGIPVYNPAQAIEKSVDKAMTSLLLQHAKIPTPETWVMESESQARRLLIKEIAQGHTLILKPLFGSQGTGLKHLQCPEDLPSLEACQGVYYLQRYIKSASNAGSEYTEDYRVFVIGNSARIAMIRKSTHWISNVAQGAFCEAVPHDPELLDLAEQASQALCMNYAGIDLIRDSSGKLHVLEVNGVPAWRGVQSTCNENIATWLVDDFIDRYIYPHIQHGTQKVQTK